MLWGLLLILYHSPPPDQDPKADAPSSFSAPPHTNSKKLQENQKSEGF